MSVTKRKGPSTQLSFKFLQDDTGCVELFILCFWNATYLQLHSFEAERRGHYSIPCGLPWNYLKTHQEFPNHHRIIDA